MKFARLIAIVAVSLLALSFISSASASLPGYSCVKDHVIAGRADVPLDDYQVMFTVHRGTGTDSGASVFLGNRSESWPHDIRFTGQGGRELDYWIQSYDEASAVIWVKVDDIPASPGTTTISMYYGRADDTGASDIGRTFIFGDEFATFDTSKWFPNDYIHQQNGGEIMIPTPGQAFYESNAIVSRSQGFVPGQALLVRLKGNGATAHYNVEIGYLDDQNRVNLRGEWQTRQTKGHVYNGGRESVTMDICPDKGNFHVYEIRRDPGGKVVEYAVDGAPGAVLNTNVYAGSGSLRIGPWVSGSQVIVDWVAVREYTPAEPAHGNWSKVGYPKGPFGLSYDDLLLIGAGTCISILLIILLIVLTLLVFLALKKK